MLHQSMSVDEFLGRKIGGKLQAIVEPIAGNNSIVKVTPWSPRGGCGCQMAINLPKFVIISVTPTGAMHSCCGQRLSVVELNLREELDLSELFDQPAAFSAANAQRRSSAESDLSFPRSVMSSSLRSYETSGIELPRSVVYSQASALALDYYSASLDTTPNLLPAPGPGPGRDLCLENYNRCFNNCSNNNDIEDFVRCACRCKNSYCACSRKCIGTQCV